MNPGEIAEVFSSHRFEDAIPHLAHTVCWVLPGQGSIDGRASVVVGRQMRRQDCHGFR